MVAAGRMADAGAAFEALQLRALRSLAWLSVVVFVLWQMLSMVSGAHDPVPVLLVRIAIVVFCMSMLPYVSAASAWRYGLALVLLFKVASIFRFYTAVTGRELIEAALFGSNRILPVLLAVFGGVRLTVGVSAWMCVEALVLVAARRATVVAATAAAAGAASGADLAAVWARAALAAAANLITSPEDHRIVFFEVIYILIATTFGCTLVQSYASALNQLGDALLARQRFITNMNHEIRTPLVGVLSMADLLLQASDLTAAMREQLRVIYSSTSALLSIVNSILDASKLQFDMMPVAPSETDIRAIVRSTMEVHEAVAVSALIPYRVVIDPNLPPRVMVDGDHIQRILANLVANAFKFGASNQVSVVIGIADASITPRDLIAHQDIERENTNGEDWLFSDDEISGMVAWTEGLDLSILSPHKAHGPYLWLKVTDRGVGISREALDRVRQLFQQADNSITRRYGGSGLGLSVSSELAALLGGELVYASAEGVGSIFVAAVPCVRPPIGRAPPGSRAGVADNTAADVVRAATSVATATSPAHLRSRFQPSSTHTPKVATGARLPPSESDPATAAGVTPTPLIRPSADPARAAGVTPTSLIPPPADPARAAGVAPTSLIQPSSDPATAAGVTPSGSLIRPSDGAGTEDAPARARSLPAAPSGSAAQAARRPTVLVVDDNAVNVMVLQRQLALLQCDTLVASDGQAAVDVVRTMLDGSAHSVTSLDLILMDLHMPNMNGLEASRAIRALEHAHRPSATPVPIITVSADSEEAMGELAREAGMQAYLRKPFVISDIRGLLERWAPR